MNFIKIVELKMSV